MVKRVLITGGEGFIGRNLRLRLSERSGLAVDLFQRGDSEARLAELVQSSDFVFHLAGVNRPKSDHEFVSGNVDLTRSLARELRELKRTRGQSVPVLYSSSTRAVEDTPYGASKRAAESELLALEREWGIRAHIFRLPNVFGKWCRPHYNSAVATFCHQIARRLPIQINDPSAALTLVYIDDVIDRFLMLMDGSAGAGAGQFDAVEPQFVTTVGEVADKIHSFHDSRSSLLTERVGCGLVRALYSTYVSYLPAGSFTYGLTRHADSRGEFVEMLKTPDCGQFSYFTAHPGVTRGGHYHHTKTEKFLVVKGAARFRFRHMHTGEAHELLTRGEDAVIVETVPGWSHDITNVGKDEMVVMLWANEVFDRERPDTISSLL